MGDVVPAVGGGGHMADKSHQLVSCKTEHFRAVPTGFNCGFYLY
jgi:hypothetical protein